MAKNTLSPVLLAFLFGLVAPILALAAQNSETKPPAASALRFRFEAVSDKSLGLWEGDRPVLVYNHGVMSKPSVPATHQRSSYIHPIYGLDGEVLTDDFPADHLDHRGLYWAWPHIKIGSREFDIWPWVFNIADSLLVFGVALLMLNFWRERKHENTVAQTPSYPIQS